MSVSSSEPPEPPAPSGAAGLRSGSLGTADIAFFVVSAAAPLTVMAGVAPLAILLGGIGAPVGYLLAGLTLAVFAVGFTTMSRHVTSGGAFYAYISRGLGRPVGIGAALLALIGYNGMEIGVYGLLATTSRDTLHTLFGAAVPWLPVSLAGLLLIGYGGYRSIDFGAKVLGVLLVCETGILVLLAGGVLAKGGAHGLSLASLAPAHVLVPGMAAVLAFAFAAFTGFESTVIYRREARDPGRTVPRATYLAVGFLGLFYAFVVWIAVQAFGDDQVVRAAGMDPAGLFFTAISTYVGGWAADLMHVFIVTSVIASLLAFHNAINRYVLALAEEGVLPRPLGRIHPRHRSPYLAGIAQTVLGAVVVLAFWSAHADPYQQLLLWVNTPGMIGLLLLQLLAAIAVPCYFRRVRHTEGAVRTVLAPVLATVLLATAIALVVTHIDLFTGASATVNILLVVVAPAVFLLGLPLAWWLRRSRPEVYARFAMDPGEQTRPGADSAPGRSRRTGPGQDTVPGQDAGPAAVVAPAE
ncbi:amino acid/polyamine/organocation transporter (APC superfamily) [Streptomyces puniciscabiei]|uniref:Amino acid/polyamine/organocation transporter (APC superfamily) n=1 Tax=Streptomyces puniciscabiei TaxID=164348 RepID=A0A542SZR5_9ACTN|nr:APC family permease [Streptomyces puniciscabiei]TQK79797.1 amino acid/polyamine/organocation transporter (APC superfamily) [Streptomyces puniciscabiei]